MTQVSVPKGCFGLQTLDGRKFDADRRGHVDVPERYAAEVRSCTTAQIGEVVVTSDRTSMFVSRENSRLCPRCHFSAWGWQTTCPRDGTPLVDDNTTEEVLV